MGASNQSTERSTRTNPSASRAVTLIGGGLARLLSNAITIAAAQSYGAAGPDFLRRLCLLAPIASLNGPEESSWTC